MSEHQEQMKVMQEEIEKKVPWTVFVWAIGIVLIALGWLITANNTLADRTDAAIQRVGDVEGDIKAIKVNVDWIRATLEKRK